MIKTKGKYKDYKSEIQESYHLGFTPFREHTKETETWITPLRCYDNAVYALDSVGVHDVTDDDIEKLVYCIKKNSTDDGSITSIIGPRDPTGSSGERGIQGKRERMEP